MQLELSVAGLGLRYLEPVVVTEAAVAAVATNSPCPPAQGLWLPRAVLMAARLTGGMLHEFEDQRAARTATMYSAAREEFQALLRAAVPRRSRAAYHLRVIIHRDPHSGLVG